MEPYVMAFDVGTSGVKTAVIAADGRLLACAGGTYPLARSSHGIRFQRIAEPNECQGHLPYHKHQNKSHHEHAYIKNSGHQSRSNRQHQKQPSPPKPSARKKRSRGRGGDAEYTCPYQRISVFRAEQSEALCRRARAMPRYPAPVRGNGGIALRDFLCRPSSGYSCGKNPPSLCQKCRFS